MQNNYHQQIANKNSNMHHGGSGQKKYMRGANYNQHRNYNNHNSSPANQNHMPMSNSAVKSEADTHTNQTPSYLDATHQKLFTAASQAGPYAILPAGLVFPGGSHSGEHSAAAFMDNLGNIFPQMSPEVRSQLQMQHAVFQSTQMTPRQRPSPSPPSTAVNIDCTGGSITTTYTRKSFRNNPASSHPRGAPEAVPLNVRQDLCYESDPRNFPDGSSSLSPALPSDNPQESANRRLPLDGIERDSVKMPTSCDSGTVSVVFGANTPVPMTNSSPPEFLCELPKQPSQTPSPLSPPADSVSKDEHTVDCKKEEVTCSSVIGQNDLSVNEPSSSELISMSDSVPAVSSLSLPYATVAEPDADVSLSCDNSQAEISSSYASELAAASTSNQNLPDRVKKHSPRRPKAA